MAVKLANTTVIDNSRILQNITGAEGVLGNLKSKVSTSGVALDFTKPVDYRALTSNTNFTSAVGRSRGHSKLLLLDLNGFTPTFGSFVQWPNDVTPDWASNRFWVISMVCWDSTTITANALSSDLDNAPSSSLVPLSYTQFVSIVSSVTGEDLSAQITIRNDGTIQTLITNDDNGFNETESTLWLDTSGGEVASDYELVISQTSGISPDIGAMGTFNLGTNRSYGNYLLLSAQGSKVSNLEFRIQEIANPSNFVERTVGTSGNLIIEVDNTGN